MAEQLSPFDQLEALKSQAETTGRTVREAESFAFDVLYGLITANERAQKERNLPPSEYFEQ